MTIVLFSFSPHNAPAKLRALSEKEASRQLQPVVGRLTGTVRVDR